MRDYFYRNKRTNNKNIMYICSVCRIKVPPIEYTTSILDLNKN